jgi:hypothetical protein
MRGEAEVLPPGGSAKFATAFFTNIPNADTAEIHGKEFQEKVRTPPVFLQWYTLRSLCVCLKGDYILAAECLFQSIVLREKSIEETPYTEDAILQEQVRSSIVSCCALLS